MGFLVVFKKGKYTLLHSPGSCLHGNTECSFLSMAITVKSQNLYLNTIKLPQNLYLYLSGPFLTSFLCSILSHLLVKLPGVVAKHTPIVSFAFNPARSYKDIIGLRTFYHVGNFCTILHCSQIPKKCIEQSHLHCDGNCNFYI